MAGAAGSVMVSSAPLVAVSIKIISFALAVSDDVAVLVAPPPDVATGSVSTLPIGIISPVY